MFMLIRIIILKNGFTKILYVVFIILRLFLEIIFVDRSIVISDY